jgi:hypothetical protein
VRTIVGKMHGADRNTKRRARRLGLDPIKIDRERVATWRRRRRNGDALPGRVGALLRRAVKRALRPLVTASHRLYYRLPPVTGALKRALSFRNVKLGVMPC